MAIGSKVGFPGEAVPLHGNSEIRQGGTTAADTVTITLNSSISSTTGGRALVIERYNADAQASGTGGNIFECDYDGVRGRRHIINVTDPAASTAYTIAASQSGAMFFVAGSSPIAFTLPTAAAGLWYEFMAVGAVSSGYIVAAATDNMMTVFNDSAAGNITVGSSGLAEGGSLRVIGALNHWYAITQPNFGSAAPTSVTITDYDFA